MKISKKRLEEIIREELLRERLKRFKVYVSGESEPLVLMGKDVRSVKQLAHQMIQNSSVRIKKVVKEAKKRDYKAEYKKYGSSTKSKKYRAELNDYNRKKGTYGNGDGKDASHKGGKIAGFEKESVNRGRREKSRLKKEGKLNEFNKAHFLNLIKQQIESLKGQIAWANDKVRYKETPDWEKKEFKAILKDKIKDLKDTAKHYKRVQKLKEGKLTEGNPYEVDFLMSVLSKDKIIDRFRKYFGGKKGKTNR